MTQTVTKSKVIPVDKLGLINYQAIPWTKIRWDFVGARKSFDEKTKQFVNQQRFKILYELRHKFCCVPIIGSEWRVRDEKLVPDLRKAAAKWKQDYADHGIEVFIGVEPYATSTAGYKLDETFEMSNIINNLNGIDTTLQKGLDERLIYKDTLRARMRDIEILDLTLKGDFTKKDPRYNEACDLVAMCQDKAALCEQISVIRRGKNT